ncbi:MAG: hypothetical protein EA420_05280 [Candidatus Competibacteraceae bacterium]|nr:MAG: hypothetical protein EA420_05280 [Candidatus Competibacteraceae bacterium]
MTWLYPDGNLNPDPLRDAFLAFWRQRGQPLPGSAPYHEIAPHPWLVYHPPHPPDPPRPTS